MHMPNKHYFEVDFSKFSKLVSTDNKNVYLPLDKPSGIIYAQLNRKNFTVDDNNNNKNNNNYNDSRNQNF